jgi:hypothetical protein
MRIGIGIGLQFNKSAGGFTAEYQAVISRATDLGYTLPSASVQAKQDTFLAELKTSGVWDKLDVFYCFAQDGSKEFATLNWKSPSANQCTLVNSPTWTSNVGFKSDGATSYIDTNFNASTQGVQFTNNSAGEFAYQIGALFGTLFGTSGGAGDGLVIGTTVGQRLNMLGTNLTASTDMNGDGFKCINRTSSTAVELFNETTQLSRTTTTAARINANRRVLNGQGNFLNTLGNVYCYGAGANLTAEALTLRTAILSYKNSL